MNLTKPNLGSNKTRKNHSEYNKVKRSFKKILNNVNHKTKQKLIYDYCIKKLIEIYGRSIIQKYESQILDFFLSQNEPSKLLNHENKNTDFELNQLILKLKTIMRSKTKQELRQMTFNKILEILKTTTSKETIDNYEDQLKPIFIKLGKNIISPKIPNSGVYDKQKVYMNKEIIDLKPGNVKCPKSYRKYKTGKCYKYVKSSQLRTRKNVNSSIYQSKKHIFKLGSGRKKCPRGYRKNKFTQYCESI